MMKLTVPIPDSPVKLGAIGFINTLPIYFALPMLDTAGRLEVVYDNPAQLNQKMLAGAWPISPVSSACYLRNRDRFTLLPGLSVSSPGAVESVLFVSRAPWGPALMDLPAIAVPDDSETSVALLAGLLSDTLGADVSRYFKFYAAGNSLQTLSECGCALVIGDRALQLSMVLAAASNEIPYYCYDLSSMWVEKTNLPFVFAVWVAQNQWAKDYPETLTYVGQCLQESKTLFFEDKAVFERGVGFAASKSGLPESLIRRYYTESLSFDLTPLHQQALQLFGQVLSGNNVFLQMEKQLDEQPIPALAV